MNKTVVTSISILLFTNLFAISFKVHAEHVGKIVAGTLFNPKYNSTVSADSVLQHNNRLIYGSVIGATLFNTKNSKAKNLYQQAIILNEQEIFAFRNGKEEQAKDFSSQSIHYIYIADRQHYNLNVDK